MTTPAGPGRFSERTDKAVYSANQALPNAGYGEAKEYQDIKSSAPLAQGEQVPQMDINALLQGARRDVVPIGAESTMPETPVTDGAALGPGAGPEALAAGQAPNPNRDILLAYLPALEFMANRPNSSDAARNLIRNLKANLG